MLITDHFVLLNFPKTGSTFARQSIKQLHWKRQRIWQKVLRKLGWMKPAFIEILLPMYDHHGQFIRNHQHGTVRDVPPEHRSKPLVSIVRNPFSRYASEYRFGWWRKHPFQAIEAHPNFPDLSFEEFLLVRLYPPVGGTNRSKSHRLGSHSRYFLRFYSENWEAIPKDIDETYLDERGYESALAPVRFLYQERLREELFAFLRQFDYSDDELQFILDAPRVNTTEKEKPFMAYYTPALIDEVLHRERLIFDLFPTYRTEAEAYLQQVR